MNYVYYCPVCGKFSKDKSSYSKTTVTCSVCQKTKAFVMEEDEFTKTKRSMNAEQWEEYKQTLREKAIEVINQLEQKEKARKELEERVKKCIVSTGDIKEDYDVIAPVYFQVNNRGNTFGDLKAKYSTMLENNRASGQSTEDKMSGMEMLSILFLNAGGYNGHSEFDEAFFIAVEELKMRAALLGADAIIWMRQDIDLDSTGWQYFYLQMYGTAVKFRPK